MIRTPGIDCLSLTSGALLLVSLCSVFGRLQLAAQSQETLQNNGALQGKLTDWHSTPLPGTVVIVRNLSTGATARTVTGNNGNYRFTDLDPGEYRLEAHSSPVGKGADMGAVEGILISAGHTTRVQAALVMQLPAEATPLDTDLHQLDPVAAAVTTLISADELDALPLATRNWQEFAAITPGVIPGITPGPQEDNQLGSQIGAQGSDDSSFGLLRESLAIEGSGGLGSSIDGMPAKPAFRSPEGRESTASLGSSAIESVQARSGIAIAASATGPGSATNLATKHGQNGFHGQAFLFARQNLWGAQNPYTQRIEETAPVSGYQIAQFAANPYTPPNNRQSFGVGIGRQFKRDKLYWFAALDGLLRSDPALATVRHPDNFFAQPTNAELTVLAARLGLPDTDPIDEGAAAYSRGLEQLAALLGTVPRSATQLQGFGRVDWQIDERQHLSVEGELAGETAPAGARGRSSETYGSHSFGNSQAASEFAVARWDSFLTANLLNSLGVEFRRLVESETSQTPSAFEAPLIANAFGQLPEIVADSKYGFILGKPADLGSSGKSRNPDERVVAAQEMLSWVHGSHLLKAGGSFEHSADSVNSLVNQTGTYSYADVLNFLTDESGFTAHGFPSAGGTAQPYNCDGSTTIHQYSDSTYTGLGSFPCYAWYSQRIGPADWSLSTNDLAAYVSEQWQPLQNLTFSAGLRLDAEQLPSPIAGVANPGVPATEQLPRSPLNWGPRFGMAWSPSKSTILRAGAGLYFGRIDNSVVLAALSQTGSPNSDLNFFFKPTDIGAPPFPYVFSAEPQTVVTPGAVSFAPRFRVQEVDQAVVGLEQELPSHWLVSASALISLGRRLPISIDTNLAPAVDASGKPQTIPYDVVDAIHAGPIQTPTITAPLYTERIDSNYQQEASIESRANSTYDAAVIKIVRNGGRGLSLRAHYLYAHATDWNPNESSNVAANNVLDPADFRLEYGTSNLDIRHSASANLVYVTPWKLRNWAGYFANGWGVAAIGQFRSGLPFTMRTGGYIPGYYQTLLNGGHPLMEGVGPGINGSGGDNRIYGVAGNSAIVDIGRNTYRYPATWTADTRLSKKLNFANHRELELLAESYNLFNHQNVTRIETTGYIIDRGSTDGGKPTFNFLTGLTKAGLPSTTPEFGNPLDVNATNFYRPREFQFGVRARF